MDWGLFGVGVVGALVTVYLAKDEVIPEFRSIFDTSEADKERSSLQEKIKKTAKEIDDAQAKILKNPSSDEAKNLNTFIETSQKELDADTKRLQGLESQITWSQIWRKGVGLVVYIFLGGVIGSLLADWVEIEGATGALPKVLTALVVGAGWTGYLSAIGMKSISKKTDDTIQNNQKEAGQTLVELKKKVEDLTKQLTAKSTSTSASTARGVTLQPEVELASITKLAEDLKLKLDDADSELQKNFDVTRQKVRRDLKGIL